MLVLGAWSTRINKWGAFGGSLLSGALYIVLSPYVFSDFSVGDGLVAKLGYSVALITVPVGFMLTIGLSLLFERLKSEEAAVVLNSTQELVERMHGWPSCPSSGFLRQMAG